MDSTVKKVRDGRMDCLKGIAISLVVIGHIRQFGFPEYESSLIFNITWTLQMPLFMVISGYFAGGGGILKSIKNKAISYLVPFVSWNVITLLLKVEPTKIIDWICDLPFHLDSSLWYMYVLFVLSLIHTLSLNISQKIVKCDNSIKQYITYTILYGLFLVPQLIFLIAFGAAFLGCKYVLYYSLFYWVGYMWHGTKRYYDNLNEKLKLKTNNIINIITLVAVIIYLIIRV